MALVAWMKGSMYETYEASEEGYLELPLRLCTRRDGKKNQRQMHNHGTLAFLPPIRYGMHVIKR